MLQRETVKIISALVLAGVAAACAEQWVFGYLSAQFFLDRTFRESFGAVLPYPDLLVIAGGVVEQAIWAAIVLVPTGYLLARASLLSVRFVARNCGFAIFVFCLTRSWLPAALLDPAIPYSVQGYITVVLVELIDLLSFWLLIAIGVAIAERASRSQTANYD